MVIDYRKRGLVRAESSPMITLTKTLPKVSLTKQGSITGVLTVNLNWNARCSSDSFGLDGAIDLDLGCLYEFTDRTRGVVQALGNLFQASPSGVREPVIRLDGDDRSGAGSVGENLFIDLAHAHRIRRVLVFALIYEGVANWAAVDGVVTLVPAHGPPVEVRLDDARNGARICGVVMLEGDGAGLSVRREVNYIFGGQSQLDRAYGWGMSWGTGHK